MKRIIFVLVMATTALSCDNATKREQEAALKARQYSLDSMRQELAKQRVIDSMNAIVAAQEEERQAAQAERSATRRSSYSSNRSGSYAAERVPAPTVVYDNTNNTTTEPQKKRWSSKATGALIGAGAGALGGALIGKKKGTGAVVGGAAGAAVGLGAGAIIDAQRKKKEEQRRQEQQQR